MTRSSKNRTRFRAVVMTVTLGGLALTAGAHADDWGYTGDHAPAFWAKTPGWEACAGTAATARQSPIDIDKALADAHKTRDIGRPYTRAGGRLGPSAGVRALTVWPNGGQGGSGTTEYRTVAVPRFKLV